MMGCFLKNLESDSRPFTYTGMDYAGPFDIKNRMNAIVEYFDTQIPVTQLKGPKGNGDMQAVKRD